MDEMHQRWLDGKARAVWRYPFHPDIVTWRPLEVFDPDAVERRRALVRQYNDAEQALNNAEESYDRIPDDSPDDLLDGEERIEACEVLLGKLTRAIDDLDAHHNVSPEDW